jgi:hypothetical protein
VGRYPQLWVPPKREHMSFFQLHRGRLILPERDKVDLTPDTDSDLDKAPTWKTIFMPHFHGSSPP